MNLFIAFMLGSLFDLICNLMVESIRRRWRKECNYDCSTCRVWDCGVHLCNEQKRKEIISAKKQDS